MTHAARSVRVRGIVQGVGFRPFVHRIAQANALHGWVLNAGDMVEIHVEGAEERIATFLSQMESDAPPAATIAHVEVTVEAPREIADFVIRQSRGGATTSVHVAPDLPVCARCLAEMRDPAHRLHGYPYINCTDCGPRFSIIQSVPYDRAATTMREWPMCPACAAEYHDPMSRRFHAQPVACAACGPGYHLVGAHLAPGQAIDAVADAAMLLRGGKILAIKGIGGYHLACDAGNPVAVARLRNAKFRKAKPFAVMVRDLAEARRLATVSLMDEAILTSPARPVVLLPARIPLDGVHPGNIDIGVMLPYTPLHHLLFDRGVPPVLVMTSANRSSEPIAFVDADALARLSGIADAFLIGDRVIARRVDDSVVRPRKRAMTVLRRSRGYAPLNVASFPHGPPILAVGGDLKNSIALVVGGEAFMSQHIGDLEHADVLVAFRDTIDDLLSMHGVEHADLLVAADAHPQYRSTMHARELHLGKVVAVQHHRAHVASVLAERGALSKRVIGVAFDGTGYGDDGAIWGGEFFAGSVAEGFARVAHLREAALVGGDAAAAFPVQAAAGFVADLPDAHRLTAAPFQLPERFGQAIQALRSGTRVFPTTSMGRLFDTVAALLGFTTPLDFEGEAAIWLEQLARGADDTPPYPFPFVDRTLDHAPLLTAIIRDRNAGIPLAEIAARFHSAVAAAVANTALTLAAEQGIDTIVASGGVFQNVRLLDDVESRVVGSGRHFWINERVPTNDGGLSLGQAALAAMAGGAHA